MLAAGVARVVAAGFYGRTQWIFWEIGFSFSRRLLWWDEGLHLEASCLGVLASSGDGSLVAGDAGGIAVGEG
jgi:hypothetical protein